MNISIVPTTQNINSSSLIFLVLSITSIFSSFASHLRIRRFSLIRSTLAFVTRNMASTLFPGFTHFSALILRITRIISYNILIFFSIFISFFTHNAGHSLSIRVFHGVIFEYNSSVTNGIYGCHNLRIDNIEYESTSLPYLDTFFVNLYSSIKKSANSSLVKDNSSSQA